MPVATALPSCCGACGLRWLNRGASDVLVSRLRIDDAYVGTSGGRRGRGTDKSAIICAVETVVGRGCCIRLVADVSGATYRAFIHDLTHKRSSSTTRHVNFPLSTTSSQTSRHISTVPTMVSLMNICRSTWTSSATLAITREERFWQCSGHSPCRRRLEVIMGEALSHISLYGHTDKTSR